MSGPCGTFQACEQALEKAGDLLKHLPSCTRLWHYCCCHVMIYNQKNTCPHSPQLPCLIPPITQDMAYQIALHWEEYQFIIIIHSQSSPWTIKCSTNSQSREAQVLTGRVNGTLQAQWIHVFSQTSGQYVTAKGEPQASWGHGYIYVMIIYYLCYTHLHIYDQTNIFMTWLIYLCPG